MEIVFQKPQGVYAAWRKDEVARAKSSSGGMAAAISEKWIKKGGIVYGAAFVRPFDFQHIRCTTKEELAQLRGSKYVQSSIAGIYKQIEADLKGGREVLFIGTPCQVAAIRNRFKENDVRLHTIDIICHGTPKVEMLKASIPQVVLQMDYDKIEFRENDAFQISFKKGDKTIWSRPLSHDLYMKGFFKALFYRDCCYKCAFAKQKRISDMTLGDFWGLDMTCISTTMDKGISLVFVNSDKGRKLLEMVEDAVEMVQRPLAEAIAGNKQLRHPMTRTWRYHIYKKLYPKVGFRLAAIAAMPDIMLKNIFK